jgi:AcrR family transcriptional regulator
MVRSAVSQPRRKGRDRYHHGDLRKALLEEALRTIQVEGVSGLTLRGIGNSLGVSRTALYRHFADKSALLSAVATEGFRMLRRELVDAWERGGRGWEGFQAQGAAYVRFAVRNPSHYRVMFGGYLGARDVDPELAAEGQGAFQALVDALLSMQREGLARRDDPLALARFIWATVHGISMLAIDGMLGGKRAEVEDLARFACERIRTGVSR